jgi:hypothetical protein
VEQFPGSLHGREDGGRKIPWQARAQTGTGAREHGSGATGVTRRILPSNPIRLRISVAKEFTPIHESSLSCARGSVNAAMRLSLKWSHG